MKAFDGKVVIITGSARGLGRDYAKYFAQDGARLVLADVKAPDSAANDAIAAGGEAISVQTDVTDRNSVEAMVAAAMAAYGRVDILINNAGLWRSLEAHGLLDCPDDVWTSAWDVNVTGTWLCYQAAVNAMKDNTWGRIINISSMASYKGANTYGLTKAAVEHMTSGMAREVGKFGITVNCISPGICAFEGAKGNIPELDAIVARNPVSRMGKTRDLYSGVRYLCSDDAEWVTGQTLRIDGGTLTA